MLKVNLRGAVAMLLALLAAHAAPATAQVPWDSPQLLAPSSLRGLSVLYVDFGLRPQDGTGVVVGYRTADAPRGMAVRFASTFSGTDSARVSLGLDWALPLASHSSTFPLDVVWTTGVGASHGDYGAVGVPIGFAASRALSGENVWFHPYMATRVVLETYMGPDRPDEQLGMSVAADVGADVSFDRRRRFVFRTALALGDRHAVVIGLHLSP